MTSDNEHDVVRDKPITDKQESAIINMRRALGNDNPYKNLPTTLSAASAEIKRLKAIINNNLSLCGFINPRHSYELRSNQSGWDGFE